MRLLCVNILLLFCSTALGQIDVPAITPQGKKIIATFATKAPSGAKVKYLYETSDNANYEDLGSGRIALWGTSHQKSTIRATAIWAIDGEPDGQVDQKSFAVGEAPKPEPTPPTPATLRELVSADEAKVIAEYLRVLAAGIADIAPADFWPIWELSFPVKGNAKLDAALKARLTPAVVKKIGLSVELLAVADEFDKPAPPAPPVMPSEATAATYVYDYPDMPVPIGVSTAIDRINRETEIRATLFEEDTLDGDGDVPDQYKVALEAANKMGLPAFVVQAGDTVINVVKDPKTQGEVMEAVR